MTDAKRESHFFSQANKDLLEKIRSLIESEKRLLENCYKLEQEKRQAILGIQSHRLQKLCKTEEALQKKLQGLGKTRDDFFEQLLGDAPKNLSHLLALFPKESTHYRKWKKLADSYRSASQRLVKLIRQNEVLLHETGASIQRVLAELQSTVQTKLNPCYAPSGRPGVRTSASIFLNSHA